MAKTYGKDADGAPLNLIGQRVEVSTLPASPEVIHMAKAEKAGTYVVNGNRFHYNAGDVLPEGAELAEARAEKAAPENKAKAAAPENRAAKKAD